MRLYDAHNHLQDERFASAQEPLLATARAGGVARMVVNGSCEADWPEVAAIARRFPEVQPSFGCHPWHLQGRSPQWRENLSRLLDETPGAVLGEIGLDRWKPGLAYEGQEEVFAAQLRLAAERNLPASIHCLQAWGRLHELLREGSRPARGFLLHSYGGPAEMIAPLAKLGAHFSFPGYYLHERKARQRETFKQVPPDRLLIETDAPDQLPPTAAQAHPLTDPATGQAINHPANLGAIYRGLAAWLGEPVESLAARVEENFLRLFEPALRLDPAPAKLNADA
jgi:TatD DNase family protein